jgi:hypothetical protein
LFLFGNVAAQLIGGIEDPLACPFCLLRQLVQSRPVSHGISGHLARQFVFDAPEFLKDGIRFHCFIVP